VAAESDSIQLGPDGNISVYRLVQESLTNIARHAHATKASVSIAEAEGCLVVRIADNGRGFEASPGQPARTLGLVGMRERARALSGQLQIDSAPGRGTTVTITIPLARTAPSS
jgi:signal transduction histidine kinase